MLSQSFESETKDLSIRRTSKKTWQNIVITHMEGMKESSKQKAQKKSKQAKVSRRQQKIGLDLQKWSGS